MFYKIVVLKILQNSQEDIYVATSFKLQAPPVQAFQAFLSYF